ncbi:hypothetical protein Hanom_Chr13g01184411 [Helianthus anomalus]
MGFSLSLSIIDLIFSLSLSNPTLNIIKPTISTPPCCWRRKTGPQKHSYFGSRLVDNPFLH